MVTASGHRLEGMFNGSAMVNAPTPRIVHNQSVADSPKRSHSESIKYIVIFFLYALGTINVLLKLGIHLLNIVQISLISPTQPLDYGSTSSL